MLAAAAMNFKRIMNTWKGNLLALVFRLLHIFTELMAEPKISIRIIY
jgi:hypothetical protein